MNIDNPFETFEHSAFRLEALPRYIVTEEVEALKYFQETGLVRPTDSGWTQLVNKNSIAGKKMERLRLFSEKLTDYERYEVQAYSGPKGGEVIRTALKKDYADRYLYDFWFFDEKWIAQVNYEGDGTFINFDVREATDEEKDMLAYWHAVYETAKPLIQVPFVSNTSDDMHCLQAAYMSIAKYFDPNFSISMDEWSALTGYEEDKGTWANAGIVWFKKNGYEVKHIETFDFEAFVQQPEEYLIEKFGEEVGNWDIEHTNIPAEIERMRHMIKVDVIEEREPTIDDVKKYIDDGYLLRLSINCQVLDGEEGYVGHAVLVMSYNESYVTLHDPGLPAIPNRQVTFAELEAAWGDQGKELDAIRLR